MRVGVFINARMESARLPGKHHRMINEKAALQHLLERLKEFHPIIVTGYKKDSQRCDFYGYQVYSGGRSNIPLRHSIIAENIKADAIISVDGDDLLTSPQAIRDCERELRAGHELVRTEGLPYGFNVLWGYTTAFLNECLDKPNPDDPNLTWGDTLPLNTGWGKIFAQERLHTIHYKVKNADKVHATLDTPQDLAFFQKIFKDCPADILTDDQKLTNWIHELQ
jgi:spore coat polysaccharide biosynthesis protein SpsF (cytidylyltransferase family)